MLTADDVQKWLEDRMAGPGGAAAPEQGKERARGSVASGSLGGAAPGGRGATVLVLRDPVRAPGPDSVLAAMGSAQEPERHRWPWPLTLAVGLLSGLALGVGLVGLAGPAPSWLASVLGAEEAPAEADSLAATATAPRPPAAEPSPSEAARPELGARELGSPDPAPSEPLLLEPTPVAPEAATVAPPVPAPAEPAASDAAPVQPRLLDFPGGDPRAVLVQADRGPLQRRPAPLGPIEPDAGPAVLAASARPGVEPWRPSPLLAPEPGPPVGVTAAASPAVIRVGPMQALAVPAPPDPLPPPEVGDPAVAPTVTPPANPLPRVALHLPPTLPQTAIYNAQAAVVEAGFDLAGTSLARFGVAESEVRFFHRDDAAGAARIADSLGAQARDFSTYRPAPPLGTLEVWLAPEG